MRYHVNFRDLHRQAAHRTTDETNTLPRDSTFSREVAKLARHLTDFNPELVDVWGAIEALPRERGFEASLRVALPTGSLHATGRGFTRLSAWTAVADELVARIERHKARFAGSRVRARRQSAQARRDTVDRVAEATMQQHLQTHYAKLLDFVGSEIALHETAGNLTAGSIEATELVDDVAMRALQDATKRPADIAPEHWFIKLAYEQVLDAIDSERAAREAPQAESLDEVVAIAEGPEGLTDEDDLVREWIRPAPRERTGHDIVDPRT